ncbi:MAG: hypothetical protein K8L99_06145 [Anaerolineae bacterium]|nr:hypothetical protein [Anaerolineae bacterium]
MFSIRRITPVVLSTMFVLALVTSSVSAQTLSCYMDVPASIDENQTLTVSFKCDNIPAPGVFGVELDHAVDATNITASSGSLKIGAVGQEYISGRGSTSSVFTNGDLFAGQDTLDIKNTNDITGGLFVRSLSNENSPQTAETGSLTIATATYYLPQPGTLTISMDNFILGDENGVQLPDDHTVAPVNVTVNNLNLASFVANVQREAFDITNTNRTDLTITVDGQSPVSIVNDGDNNGADFTYAETLPLSSVLVIDAPSHLKCSTAAFVLADEDNTMGTATLLAGDVTDDDAINITDSTAIGLDYGSSALADEVADVNDDQVINVLDLIHIGRNFGEVTGDCTFS